MNRILVYGMTSNPGGIESFVMNQYSLLDKSRAIFDFVVDFPEMCYEKYVREEGSEVYFISPKGKKLFSHWLALFRLLTSHPEYKKIYFNILDAGAVFTMLIPWLLGREIIVHSHNGSTQKKKLHKLCKPFLKIFAKKCLACSKAAAQYMFDTTEIDVIPNAIDCEKYRFNEKVRADKRTELGLDENTLALCFVGRLSYQKNVHFLISVFEEVSKKDKNAVLLIAGDGEEKEKMLETAKALGIEEKIRFLGKRNDVNEILQAADAYIMTSHFEGLSVVAVEAQAAGLPCVFSDGMSEETKINSNVIFVPLKESAEHWADKVLRQAKLQRETEQSLLQRAGYDLSYPNKSQTELLEYFYN